MLFMLLETSGNTSERETREGKLWKLALLHSCTSSFEEKLKRPCERSDRQTDSFSLQASVLH